MNIFSQPVLCLFIYLIGCFEQWFYILIETNFSIFLMVDICKKCWLTPNILVKIFFYVFWWKLYNFSL